MEIEKVVAKARAECAELGIKLTDKREKILTVLLRAGVPLSAYDIVEKYREQFSEALPAMSVYRILNLLVEHKIAHKLQTTNQFLACAHIACDHDHEVPQFLICDKCHGVEEVGLKKTLVDELHQSVLKTGFEVASQQLELHGTCSRCQ
jgi:Fur family transcriptional regulator, zinc uptake regulator